MTCCLLSLFRLGPRRPPPPRWRAQLLLWSLPALLFAEASAQPESTRRMVERLAQLPAAADPFGNPFYAAKTIDALRQRLAAATSPEEGIPLMPRLAEALLNAGRSREALAEFESYERMLQAYGLSLKPEFEARLLFMKALCHLRIGEQDNCLRNHNGDSCLFPIRGGGVHQDPSGSRAAVGLLTQLLERHPGRLDARWLLNLAAMTLGEYPERVPAAWLIPPEKFASDHPLARHPDIAVPLGLAIDDISGGVVMDDLDGDGDLDLMLSAFGLHSQLRLFRNESNGTFTERTAAAGLLGLTGGLNLIQADYNNDGNLDVLVLRGAWLDNEGRFPNSLLRNNGDGTFVDVTEEAGLLSFHPTQTAVWFDYNGDGWIDLFIGNESASPQSVHPCELYRNNGDGTFTECAADHGLALVGFVKAVVTADYNRDGRPDLYLSLRNAPNQLLRNDGPAAGGGPADRWQFVEVAEQAGVREPVWSFPAWFWDYDHDGWPDLFVAGYRIRDVGDIAADVLGEEHPGEQARLYRNRGDGTFSDVTTAAGLQRIIHAMGSNFGDLDNDGWLDFYAGTGDPFLGTLIPNLMFRNDAGRRFQDVTTAGGFGNVQKGHGVAFGDLNHDGAPEIYSVLGGAYYGDNYPNQLFANPGYGHRWIKLRLEGRTSSRDARGAVVHVQVQTSRGTRSIYRTVGSGGSFGASPLRQEIGLGDATAVESLEIFWPTTGRTQVIRGLQLDRAYAIIEDQEDARELPLTAFAWPAAHAETAAPHHHH